MRIPKTEAAMETAVKTRLRTLVGQLKGKKAKDLSEPMGVVTAARLLDDDTVELTVRVDPFHARAYIAAMPGRLSHVKLGFEFTRRN
jgi:hypothetical protein